MRKINLSILVFVILVVAFVGTYKSIINEFESESVINANMLGEHIKLSENFIHVLAMHGELYLENGIDKDDQFLSMLKYNPASDSYDMDAAGGTKYEKFVGNLTGLGNIPESGTNRKELNLALQYNCFFSEYYDRFPDVAWLYYTSNNNFINIYPWKSSKHFRFSEKLKTIPFFTVASPENNPLRQSVLTSAYYDEAGKGLMVTLSEPIYDKDIFMGVISLDMTNNKLNNIIESQFEGFLIDDTNTVLAYNRSNISEHSIIKLEELLKISTNEVDEIKNLNKNIAQRWGWYYIYSVSFEETPWTLVYRFPIGGVLGKSAISTLPIMLISVLLFWLINQIDKRKKSEDFLKEQRSLFKTILFSINEGIIVTNQSGKVTMMNPLAEKYTGWSNEEAYGHDFGDVFNIINLLTREKIPDPVKLVLETGVCNQSKNYSGIISKDGLETYLLGGTAPIIYEEGTIKGAVAAFRDVTKEYEQEKEIEGFLNVNLDMLCVTDTNGIILQANKKFLETFGYIKEEVEGKALLSFVHEEDLLDSFKVTDIEEDNKSFMSSFTTRYRCKDGSYKYIEWLTEERFGKYIYSSARDVTEKVIETERLEMLAVKDQLTGLYNRHFLDIILAREIEMSEKNDIPLSMIMMDVDYFKNINDTWGHAVGDEFLKHISQIIVDNSRNTDIQVRLGGEEFVILMPKTSINGAKAAAENIRKVIEQKKHPIVEKHTASFGVAERMKGETFDNWYRRADEALYQAKKEGRNRVVER